MWMAGTIPADTNVIDENGHETGSYICENSGIIMTDDIKYVNEIMDSI